MICIIIVDDFVRLIGKIEQLMATLVLSNKLKSNMKYNLFLFLALVLGITLACGGEAPQEGSKQKPKSMIEDDTKEEASDKGIGEVKNVELNDPLDPEMVKYGKAIYELKCAACHKLTDQRVVGPGWDGITSRRTPEWIMNMTLNVDVMLAEDPEARKLLEQCLVRMPNQNLSRTEARNVLEFMYANDGETVGS